MPKKVTPKETPEPQGMVGDSIQSLADRHLAFGWWSLLIFLTLGVVLELLHGFKVGWYLDVSNETRRHMWTLAHAHGTLLALVNLAFAFSLKGFGGHGGRGLVMASRCLIGAGVLMPLGFFLGGLVIHAGDPGLGIVLLPAGALLLVAGVFLAARSLSTRWSD